MSDGRLVLLGAPLGNPGDASERLRATLAAADLVAAEDPDLVARLAQDLDVSISGRLVSYDEGSLVSAAQGGACVALVTSGMPGPLVSAAHAAGVPVTAVPGPSVVTTALAVSGMPCDRFCVEGFPPPAATPRRARFAALATEERTLVFFETPDRLAATLADLAAAFGADRAGAVCQELTRSDEQVRRDGLGTLADWAAQDPPGGEVTLVVAGATARPAPDPAVLRAAVAARQRAGASHRDAVVAVAKEYGARRRDVYELTTTPAPADLGEIQPDMPDSSLNNS